MSKREQITIAHDESISETGYFGDALDIRDFKGNPYITISITEDFDNLERLEFYVINGEGGKDYARVVLSHLVPLSRLVSGFNVHFHILVKGLDNPYLRLGCEVSGKNPSKGKVSAFVEFYS